MINTDRHGEKAIWLKVWPIRVLFDVTFYKKKIFRSEKYLLK